MKPVKPHLPTDPSRLLVLLAKLLNSGNINDLKSHEDQGNSQYTSKTKKKGKSFSSWGLFTLFFIKSNQTAKKNEIYSNMSCLDKQKNQKRIHFFLKHVMLQHSETNHFSHKKTTLEPPNPQQKSWMLVFEAFFSQGGTIFRTTLEW